MKKIASLAAVLVLGAATVAPALAAPKCLWTRGIDRTSVVDPKTILFRMKDGKVYRSTLHTACLGLRFRGFAYVLHDEELCGDSQTIQVLNTGEVCALGRFVLEPAVRHG